jgi:hypothetical protein
VVVLEAGAHGEGFGGVFVPNAEAVLDEETFVVLEEFVVEAGAGDIGELHLGFARGGGGAAAFANVADAAAGGLHHLVVGA